MHNKLKMATQFKRFLIGKLFTLAKSIDVTLNHSASEFALVPLLFFTIFLTLSCMSLSISYDAYDIFLLEN